MTRDEAVSAFESEVAAAVAIFQGSIAQGARYAVRIYPLKEGPGFVWLEWDGDFDFDNVQAAIKRGGREPTFKAAIDRAVAIFCEKVDA